MMQDAESLSPFEEQRSFSKLKSLDKTRSHNLWFKPHEEKPMQQKVKKFSFVFFVQRNSKEQCQNKRGVDVYFQRWLRQQKCNNLAT